MPSQEQQDRNQLAVNEWAREMQSFTQNLGSYMQAQRQENIQAHLVNHVQIRKVEQKVDEVSEAVGCIAVGVALIGAIVLALLLLWLLF